MIVELLAWAILAAELVLGGQVSVVGGRRVLRWLV